MQYCDIIIPIWEKSEKKDLIKSLDSLIDEEKFIKNIILVIDGFRNFPEYLPNIHFLQSKFIVVYKFNNSGPGYARNCGVIFSKSENIIFLDSGDININKRIKKQLNELKNIDACFGNIEEIRPRSTKLVRESCPNLAIARKLIAYKTPFNNVTLAIKKKSFLEIGGYPSLRTAEDWVLMGKIIKNNLKIKVIDQTLVSIYIDPRFNSRRRGLFVYKDIYKCLRLNYQQNLYSRFDFILSIIINFLFRVVIPKPIFSYLYRILRTYFLNSLATLAFKKKPKNNIIKETKAR